MDCIVGKSSLSGMVSCPPSKSYTHRAVFLGALAGDSVIRGALESGDTESTISACKRLGASISDGGDVTIRDPIGGVGDARIDAGNSGTTMRIAAGVAGLLPHTTTITGDASLQKRPMGPLLDALVQAGAECTSGGGMPPVTIRGIMEGGMVSIRGDVSSQFISSLLVAAPMARNGMEIAVQGRMVSRPYLDSTISVMSEFGSEVRARNGTYMVSPGRYGGREFSVPSDASSMALLLAASVLAGGIDVRYDYGGLPQADEAFAGMLQGMGASVRTGGGVMRADPPERLSGGAFDLGDTPDLLPPLAIMSLAASDPITITNVAHARSKETDRIAVIAAELAKLGVRVQEKSDGMVLGPADKYVGAELDPRGDHRLFMAFCIAGMRVGGCTVRDAESAAVSYPGFVSEMSRLGAEIAT